MVTTEKDDKSNLEALEYLISYGADINAVDKKGNTPLHYAALLGHASIIEALERAGPNLEAVNEKGRTPLHDAALRGHAIKVLLTLGANQAAVDNDGRTPLHCAAASYYVSADAIEVFRNNEAAFESNLTAVDKKGCTPLQVYKPRYKDSKVLALLTPK